MTKPLLYIPLLYFLAVPSLLLAQSSAPPAADSTTIINAGKPQQPAPKTSRLGLIARDIEKAFTSSSADPVTEHFAKKVFLNLRGDGKGYFSGNQAHYVVKQFLEKHKISDIRLTEEETENHEPFLSGTGSIVVRGKTETVKVYIGFVHSNNTFQISQFTIY